MVYLTLVEPILKRRLFGHSQLLQSDDDVGVSSGAAVAAHCQPLPSYGVVEMVVGRSFHETAGPHLDTDACSN
jgi:hypothetical protein